MVGVVPGEDPATAHDHTMSMNVPAKIYQLHTHSQCTMHNSRESKKWTVILYIVVSVAPGKDRPTAHDHTMSMNVPIHVLVVLLSHCDPKLNAFVCHNAGGVLRNTPVFPDKPVSVPVSLECDGW